MKQLRFIPAASLEVTLLRKLKDASVLETHGPLIEKKWNRINYVGPEYFGPRSSQNAHWICQNGQETHKFVRPIGRITRAFDNQSKFGGCPFCSGRIPHEQESLASMPELARQWMEKENRCPARYVSVRSCRLAQWQCPVSKGHIYVMQISTRVKLPENKCCPSCYQGPRVNLLHFVDALAQFVRTRHNHGFDPANLPQAVKVLWRCTSNPDHLWYESFDRLQKRDFRCKKCSALANEKSGAKLADFPALVAQIDPIANENFDSTKIAAASHLNLHWKCSAGPDHTWQARVFHRTINNSGCPFCANKRASATNCLATIAPNIAQDFHPMLNGTNTAENIVATSSKLYWWLCRFCGHEWQMAARERTLRKRSCPNCETNSAPPSHSKGQACAGVVLTCGRDSKR